MLVQVHHFTDKETQTFKTYVFKESENVYFKYKFKNTLINVFFDQLQNILILFVNASFKKIQPP